MTDRLKFDIKPGSPIPPELASVTPRKPDGYAVFGRHCFVYETDDGFSVVALNDHKDEYILRVEEVDIYPKKTIVFYDNHNDYDAKTHVLATWFVG